MTAYTPHIRCEHPRARSSPQNCQRIYGTMHLSERYEHFVHERRDRRDTVVPWTVWPSMFFDHPALSSLNDLFLWMYLVDAEAAWTRDAAVWLYSLPCW